jgi:hypothetical protein
MNGERQQARAATARAEREAAAGATASYHQEGEREDLPA